MAQRDLLLVFGTVQRVMRAEKAARAAGLDVDAVPAPRAVSSQCGVVLEARLESLMLTGDENIVDVDFVVVWRIKSEELDETSGQAGVEKFLFNIREQEKLVQTVTDLTDYLLPGEENTLALQVVDITGQGGIYKPLYLAVE